jgi:hypothetical protein
MRDTLQGNRLFHSTLANKMVIWFWGSIEAMALTLEGFI